MRLKIKHLLLVLSLISIILALSSCDGEITEPLDISYTISEYTVVRPENASEDMVKAIASFRKQISANISGDMLAINDDWVKGGVITDEIASKKEILVGPTNRPESAQALEGVDSSSFVITVIGNKIVINSANTANLLKALDYFAEKCKSITDNILLLPENYCYISDPVSVVDFINGADTELKVIYLDSLDNTASSSDKNDNVDIDVALAKEIRELILKQTGIKIDISTDWYKKGTDISDKLEILVGSTTRDETAQFRSTLSYNEYGYSVIGNKIVVCGWNETTTELAVRKFTKYLKDSIKKNPDGSYLFNMLGDERAVFDYDTWFEDFPEFQGGSLVGTHDAGYGNLQLYYKDTTIDDYNKYCKTLEESGFKLFSENTLSDNVHKAYTSDEGMLYVYYVPTENSVRIISCREGKYNLPEYTTPESVPSYEKIVDSSITQCSLSYTTGNFGLCHIITLEDGSFIIYDGGGNNNNDYVALYETLVKLNKRNDGKIVIAAWILTHEHWDHYTNFSSFCKNYSNRIVLEGMYCNTPSATYAYNGYNPNYYMTDDFANLSSVLGGVKKYKLHTGMKFYIRNACIEVLYTQEDLFPKKLHFFNESTMVTRVTIAGQTITYLGDVRELGSGVMCKRYGADLKSDIVQVSHHGYDGGTTLLYKHLNPETCLWPSPAKDYDKFTSGSTDGYMAVNTYIFKNLNVKKHIFAEPTSTIMLPFKPTDNVIVW